VTLPVGAGGVIPPVTVIVALSLIDAVPFAPIVAPPPVGVVAIDAPHCWKPPRTKSFSVAVTD